MCYLTSWDFQICNETPALYWTFQFPFLFESKTPERHVAMSDQKLIRLLQVAVFERSKIHASGLWFWFTGIWLIEEVICSIFVVLVDCGVCATIPRNGTFFFGYGHVQSR